MEKKQVSIETERLRRAIFGDDSENESLESELTEMNDKLKAAKPFDCRPAAVEPGRTKMREKVMDSESDPMKPAASHTKKKNVSSESEPISLPGNSAVTNLVKRKLRKKTSVDRSNNVKSSVDAKLNPPNLPPKRLYPRGCEPKSQQISAEEKSTTK